jgi:hypothetical protein
MMSPTYFETPGFILRKIGGLFSKCVITYTDVSSRVGQGVCTRL